MKGPAADLHVHTTASDGRLSGSQVVEQAARLGLAAVAITDHDAVHGIESAVSAGRRVGVRVIPGVELSTVADVTVREAEGAGAFAPGELHVLGYFIDPGSPRLRTTIADISGHRRERILAMVRRLGREGIEIDEESVLAEAGDGSPGRPHVARVLVRAGYAASVREAFMRYLVPGRPGFVSRYKLRPQCAAAVIRSAGGVPVLAHPGLTAALPAWPEVAGWGILGLEVRHPAHTPDEACRYVRIARLHGLLPTGGSDFHGPEDTHAQLGAIHVPMSWVRSLRAEAGGRRPG